MCKFFRVYCCILIQFLEAGVGLSCVNEFRLGGGAQKSEIARECESRFDVHVDVHLA